MTVESKRPFPVQKLATANSRGGMPVLPEGAPGVDFGALPTVCGVELSTVNDFASGPERPGT